MANILPRELLLLFLTLSACHPSVDGVSDLPADSPQAMQDTADIGGTQTPRIRIPPADWAVLHLQGQVKSLTTKICRTITQPTGEEKTCKDNSIIFFNRKGYKTQEWFWDDAPLKLYSLYRAKDVYRYDENNRLLEKRSYASDNTLMMTYLFRYDPAGNQIEEILNKDGICDTRYLTEYDAAGRMIRITGYDLRDSTTIFHINTFQYDNAGNLTENKTVSSGGGGYQCTYAYVYDKDQKLVEEIYTSIYGDKDRPRKTTRFIYDTLGRLIREIYRYDNERPSTTRITRDALGNWVLRKENAGKNTALTDERLIEYY